MTEDANAEAYAHRAMAAATVLGLLEPRRGLRVVFAGADASPDASVSAGADLLIMTDAGSVADDDVAAVLRRARACLEQAGIVALVVGSIVTRELIDAATEAGERGIAAGEHGDAYARAMEWARDRTRAEVAPPIAPERLAIIVHAAASAGLTLVEAETSAVAPALPQGRRMSSPRARALLATLALGAAARPMLFVPAERAPRNGLARPKVGRLASGWVEARRLSARDVGARAPDGDLVQTALLILDQAARSGRGPLLFKELLRETRERQSAVLRAQGGRAIASASDAGDLAALLHHAAAHENVTLYALDPADPGWTLEAANGGLTL